MSRCSCMISSSGNTYNVHTPDCLNRPKFCPLCQKAVEIQHTPAIDKATGKLAHDYCLRIESVESFNLRKRAYMQKAAAATMRLIEQVADRYGIDLKAEALKSEEVERWYDRVRAENADRNSRNGY